MGCSNTKSFPSAAAMDNNAPLTNAMDVLNAIDAPQVAAEGEKLINEAKEAIEKSAAVLESAIGKNPFEEESNIMSEGTSKNSLEETSKNSLEETSKNSFKEAQNPFEEIETEEATTGFAQITETGNIIEEKIEETENKFDEPEILQTAEHYVVTSPTEKSTADIKEENVENDSESKVAEVTSEDTEDNEEKAEDNDSASATVPTEDGEEGKDDEKSETVNEDGEEQTDFQKTIEEPNTETTDSPSNPTQEENEKAEGSDK